MATTPEEPNPEAASRAVAAQLAELSDEEVDRLRDVLRHLIDHMARRIEYAEARRGSFATVAGGLIAAAIALFAIVMREDASAFRTGLAALALGFLVTGGLVLFAWGRQTNPRYGFISADTRLRRPWKWFYRDALRNSNAFDMQWWRRPTASKNVTGRLAFDEQWAPFATRQLDLADRQEDALQDMRQVYLLHVNERYKNLFLSQVRSLLVWGLITSIALGIIAMVGDAALGTSNETKRAPTESSASLSPSGHEASPSPTPAPIRRTGKKRR